jgi:hypothetical protein
VRGIDREHVLTPDEYFVVCMWTMLNIGLGLFVMVFRDPLLGMLIVGFSLWLGVPAARVR